MLIGKTFKIHSRSIIIFLTTIFLFSCSYPKILPRELTDKMKTGIKIDKKWLDNSFDHKKGYSIEPEWINKNPNKELKTYFITQAKAKSSKTYHYRMSLFIKYDNSTGITIPSINIEGRIQDIYGKDVAAFTHYVSVGFPGNGPAKYGIDKLLDAIKEEFGENIQ